MTPGRALVLLATLCATAAHARRVSPRAHIRLCSQSLSSIAPGVAPGSVLIAQPDQYDHFYHEAVMLVLEHGEGGSRGVLLNRETPFTMGELTPNMDCFAESPVYRGGNAGSDTVLMLHARSDLRGAKPVGESGLYLGGLKHAQELVSSGGADASAFKFFFNSEIWAPSELEKQIKQQVWWSTQQVTADQVVAARGDRSLHSNLKRRLALGGSTVANK